VAFHEDGDGQEHRHQQEDPERCGTAVEGTLGESPYALQFRPLHVQHRQSGHGPDRTRGPTISVTAGTSRSEAEVFSSSQARRRSAAPSNCGDGSTATVPPHGDARCSRPQRGRRAPGARRATVRRRLRPSAGSSRSPGSPASGAPGSAGSVLPRRCDGRRATSSAGTLSVSAGGRRAGARGTAASGSPAAARRRRSLEPTSSWTAQDTGPTVASSRAAARKTRRNSSGPSQRKRSSYVRATGMAKPHTTGRATAMASDAGVAADVSGPNRTTAPARAASTAQPRSDTKIRWTYLSRHGRRTHGCGRRVEGRRAGDVGSGRGGLEPG
jgi:hypothetical protein